MKLIPKTSYSLTLSNSPKVRTLFVLKQK